MTTKFYVVNENTLCFKIEGDPMMGVLAGKPQLGGRNWMNGPFTVTPSDKLRKATLQDFDFYRVSPIGHNV